MPTRPTLLFVSPIAPCTTGNGLAMRAAAMIQAYSDLFNIHLLAPGDSAAPLPNLCATWHRLNTPLRARIRNRLSRDPYTPKEWPHLTRHLHNKLLNQFTGLQVDHVHVFRLYMLPIILPVLGELRSDTSQLHLDLDDIESESRQQTVPLRPQVHIQRREARIAQFYANREQELLPVCDRIYVCGACDQHTLHQRGFDAVSIVPNTIPIEAPLPPPSDETLFNFLFIGNLNHFPNIDGLEYLIEDLLPAIRNQAPRPFQILVAGSGRNSRIRHRCKRIPEIEWLGEVQDLRSIYQQAHATIIPLRCGGGTRVKILESFSMGRPVISTPAGANGLEVSPDIELSLGQNPVSFAAACAEIMVSPELRKIRADTARQWVCNHASPKHARMALRRALNTERCS